ncbi:hypothetical protein EDD85DRAFT_547728 [Armillaria nabsnona]|nr:hypothetical protein EDD85DRAFT_547728 [Armillaria nabsnona]
MRSEQDTNFLCGSGGECPGRRAKNGTISLLGVMGDGERALPSERDFVLPDLPHSRPAPGLNARRTPASLVSPSIKQTLMKRALLFGSGAKFCRSKHTPRPPASQSHRSLLVSPRQTVLCRSSSSLVLSYSLPWMFLFTITKSLDSTPTLEGIRSLERRHVLSR